MVRGKKKFKRGQKAPTQSPQQKRREAERTPLERETGSRKGGLISRSRDAPKGRIVDGIIKPPLQPPKKLEEPATEELIAKKSLLPPAPAPEEPEPEKDRFAEQSLYEQAEDKKKEGGFFSDIKVTTPFGEFGADIPEDAPTTDLLPFMLHPGIGATGMAGTGLKGIPAGFGMGMAEDFIKNLLKKYPQAKGNIVKANNMMFNSLTKNKFDKVTSSAKGLGAKTQVSTEVKTIISSGKGADKGKLTSKKLTELTESLKLKEEAAERITAKKVDAWLNYQTEKAIITGKIPGAPSTANAFGSIRGNIKNKGLITKWLEKKLSPATVKALKRAGIYSIIASWALGLWAKSETPEPINFARNKAQNLARETGDWSIDEELSRASDELVGSSFSQAMAWVPGLGAAIWIPRKFLGIRIQGLALDMIAEDNKIAQQTGQTAQQIWEARALSILETSAKKSKEISESVLLTEKEKLKLQEESASNLAALWLGYNEEKKRIIGA